MEQQKYLIDTNAVIDYIGNILPSNAMLFMNNIVDEIPYVSIITKIEVLGFETLEEHYKLLSDFMDDALIFGLTDDIVKVCIEIRKKYNVKLPDALIAATSLAKDLILISRNNKDFRKIKELKFIDPWYL